MKGALPTPAAPHFPSLPPGWDRCLFWVPSVPPSFKWPLAPCSSLWLIPYSRFLGSQVSECFAYNFLFPQARTEFLRKKARHRNSLPELEAADTGAPSSGPVDLFRELLEEGKGVTRSNKEYEEEKRQEKVSPSSRLPQSLMYLGGGSTLPSGANRSLENRWGLSESIPRTALKCWLQPSGPAGA